MTATRLPVIGSTAASTAFVSERLDGPYGLHLFLDGNGKITAGNGTLATPRPNAFSLPAAGISGIEHCPGSTATCRKACYVENLKGAQPDLYALYEHNAETIRAILECTDESLRDLWVTTLGGWIRDNAAGGFRWHVSGDIFSFEHAEFIADVCRESPGVRHWIYTRSFDFLEPISKVSTLRGGNLAINLSCDQDNYEEAQSASVQYGCAWTGPDPGFDEIESLRLCYLTVDGKVPDDLGPDDVIFPDYSLRPRAAPSLQDSEFWAGLAPMERGLVCPVDAHGKSEKNRCGPCSRCLK